MGGGVQVRILGPVEAADDDGVQLALGPPKQRALLVALALRAGAGITVAELVDTLWPVDPPASAVKNIQLYVHRLRRLLDAELAYRDGTYRVDADAVELDADVFEALAAQARRAVAAGEWSRAAELYRQALSRWRGPALADVVARGLLLGPAGALDQARLTALDEFLDVEGRLRGPQAVLRLLHRLVAQYPLHEPFRERQLRALLATGRRSEALLAYEETRELLATELGVEPGPRLGTVGAALDDPAETDGLAPPVPAELPADIADFTGRDEQVAEACTYFGGAGPSALRICVVTGTAGVGKSAFAVHVAHRVRGAYPGGQLYVNLHGISPHRVDPADVLAQFLRALGRPAARLPVAIEERVRLYRSILADRRVLVVLDGAGSEDQVRPLLPGGAGCAALITARTPLAGLEGARQMPLDVLDRAAALRLLSRAAGRTGPDEHAAPAHDGDRPAGDKRETAAERIVELCGRLPLAVRIAGARLNTRPHWTLSQFADRLADRRRRLDELRAGELDVRASFDLSYRALDRPTRHTFHLLALLEQPTVTTWLAAALLRVSPVVAEDRLEALVDAQLLQALPNERYTSHDLLRVYAAETASAMEPDTARQALDGAFAAWVAAAERAAAAMSGEDAAARAARRWFTQEQDDLVAAVRQAHRTGRWPVTWRLAQALTRYLEQRSRWSAWQDTHELAVEAAHAAGEVEVEAALTQRLGDLYRDRGRFDEAAVHFRRALTLAEATGSSRQRADALCGMGDVSWGHGDARGAAKRYGLALALYEEIGEARGAAFALRGLSYADRQLGRLDEAIAAGRRCVAAFQRIGDDSGEAYARRTLGSTHLDRGELEAAAACFVRCFDDFAALGDRLGQAAALMGLGMAQVEQGRYEEAAQTYQACRAAFADVSDPLGEAYARRGLGDALTGLGRFAEAEAELGAALDVFEALGDVRWQGYALLSLGRLEHLRPAPDRARDVLRQALTIFEAMPAPLWTARARALLDSVDAPG
ncbi:BTAD domain-containing putative transcriptional regulator [Dactylosporangium matsuzakiense]|uniref:SARP family transcriptional regulator n=1 Tax=Dactylosporangium matsuzakiense TaxID=53360 RepID=A0A9W6KQ73_9ACTN|nr:SARP family transcriptional regulator [Dactylosporangium matsuzakiense]